MRLVEIKGLFQMDTGAPSPVILSSSSELLVTFYADDESIILLKFKGCLQYTFGTPSNETIHGHPYYELGLESYAFYRLENSNLIKHLEGYDKAHHYYNPDRWKEYKHYIITFHDNMFECIAKQFEFQKGNVSIYQQANAIINESV